MAVESQRANRGIMNKSTTSAQKGFYPWNFRPRPVHILVTGLLITGLTLFLHRLYLGLSANDETVTGALLGGAAAAAATAIGTLPMLYARPLSQRVVDSLLGFGAGVMLAASSFSLILPALTVARDQGVGGWGAGGIVGLGILLGAAALF